MGLTVYTTAGGSAQNQTQAMLDFGHRPTLPGEGDYAQNTVLASWVTASTILSATYSSSPTVDHDGSDYWVEKLEVYTENIIPGVSFDIVGEAPNNTWGRYLVNITGEG